MAHADYDCCAICDSKQSYNGNAKSKAEICSECVAGLARLGVIVGNVGSLIIWIESSDEDVLRATLKQLGFHFCYYCNDVDDAVDRRGVKMNSDRLIE